jgi:stalled ribosome rescue protein Dom34
MGIKAGVWINHRQAVVVLITDAGQETKKIAFDIGQPVRSAGKSSSKKKYTPNDFVAEDRLGRKVENDRKDYYNDVIACIKSADSLLILGPGEAKGELSKHIKAKKVRGVVVELETTDKMTDRQIAAKVQQHFATKTASPKKSVKKAAKATAVKSKKKSGK